MVTLKAYNIPSAQVARWPTARGALCRRAAQHGARPGRCPHTLINTK